MKDFQTFRIAMIALVYSSVIAGCATAPENGRETATAAAAPGRPAERVSFRQESGALGAAVRAVGEQCGGGIVLMAGLEEHPVGAIKIQKSPYEALVRRIADEAGLLIESNPDYSFLYPAGYESLAPLGIGDALNPVYAEVWVSASFGAGTKMYNVLALLGHMLRLTIVADNAVAETVCGEMSLAEAPLARALEAILKSARLRPDAIAVESTDEYIFIRSSANQQPESALLNADALTEEQQQVLDKRVTVYLPDATPADGHVYVYRSGKSVRGAIGTLSRQINLGVYADEPLQALPVNPVVMNNVRVHTALDLLVRQWPLPEFGYELRDDGIHLRRR